MRRASAGSDADRGLSTGVGVAPSGAVAGRAWPSWGKRAVQRASGTQSFLEPLDL
jgi:hypothetical protein